MARPRSKGRKDWPPGLYKKMRHGKAYYYFSHKTLDKLVPLGTDFSTAKESAASLYTEIALRYASETTKRLLDEVRVRLRRPAS